MMHDSCAAAVVHGICRYNLASMLQGLNRLGEASELFNGASKVYTLAYGSDNREALDAALRAAACGYGSYPELVGRAGLLRGLRGH